MIRRSRTRRRRAALRRAPDDRVEARPTERTTRVPVARRAAAGANTSPMNGGGTRSIGAIQRDPLARSAGLRTPLSGPTRNRSSLLTASALRAEPTPIDDDNVRSRWKAPPVARDRKGAD